MSGRTLAKDVTRTYWSLSDMADRADPAARYARRCDAWIGHATLADAQRMAREGWTEDLAVTLELVQSAVGTIEHDMERYVPRWEYAEAGDEPDVVRYLSGEPECMVSYPLVPLPSSGRVIALVASVAVSHAVSAEAMRRRGAVIAAFALALCRIGVAVEVWADVSLACRVHPVHRRMRVLVKPHDGAVDESVLSFALAHPAMLRQVAFACWRDFADVDLLGRERVWSHGWPTDPAHDMPEGTIYLPSVLSDRDVPDADVMLRDLLRQAGYLADDNPAS